MGSISPKILDGRALAARIKEELKKEVARLAAEVDEKRAGTSIVEAPPTSPVRIESLSDEEIRERLQRDHT